SGCSKISSTIIKGLLKSMPVLKKPDDAKTSNRAHPTPYLIGGLQITAIPCAAAHYPPVTIIVYSITKKDFILKF
ncbi:hypothetical protein, partial [Mordavella massiliensis]|uniref:hypothetical protein n=1 Tax=Mordavella massiliensis TaxID=1871024 RepID=UPI00210D2469|nr:hypothetical protein [Mordavella massiliensis]